MKCWIASFPRSGNTFFRNILYYVYGLESGTWHKETAYPVDKNYDKYIFVKTHLLPDELMPDDPAIPAIYLVRDGRDAIVSIAHHRSDLVNPGSDFLTNMKESIVAAEGSFFGGWSKNVSAWLKRAQLVIRYEDLISDPQAVFARIEQIVQLPQADWSKLPQFDQLKSGKAKYGGESKLTNPKFNPEEFSSKFFRKGKSGAYRTEMPDEIRDLFWNYHGDTMERMGYDYKKHSVTQNPVLDYRAMKLLGKELPVLNDVKFHVLIEATKLANTENDGIKRYLIELLKGFREVSEFGDPRWNFELIIGRKFVPLAEFWRLRKVEVHEMHGYEKVLMAFKSVVKSVLPSFVYDPISELYKKTDARKLLRKIQREQSVSKEIAFYEELEIKKKHVDLLHIPLPQNSDFLKSLSHYFVVTVHDITHRLLPQFHEQSNVELAEEGMKFITDKNAHVISVSANTTSDMLKFYDIPHNHIHLVYEAPDMDLFKWNVNHDLEVQVRNKYKLGEKPYFLSLSTIEPRKNLPNTIRAFNLLIEENPEMDINLVISGSFGWKSEHLKKELHLDNPRIIFTGYVDDADLKVIYSGALALCYISVYEGFGLPPVEAMSCRTTVIYGNNSSMTEVIGDAGLPADENDIVDIKNKMLKIYKDHELREALRIKAHHKSFEFNWRNVIYHTLKVYEKIITEKN